MHSERRRVSYRSFTGSANGMGLYPFPPRILPSLVPGCSPLLSPAELSHALCAEPCDFLAASLLLLCSAKIGTPSSRREQVMVVDLLVLHIGSDVSAKVSPH